MLDVASPSDEQRALIVAGARACLGTRFHFNQRQPGRVIDCVGVIRHAMQHAGLYCPPDIHYSARTCFGMKVYDDCRDSMDELPLDARPVGAVILLWLRRPEYPQHLGVWTGSTLVHADTRAKRVIETPGISAYDDHVFGVFDMRETSTPAHRQESHGNSHTHSRR